MINISTMEKTISSMQKRYLRYVKSGQSRKKREQDVHLTPKDERILIESILISNLINQGVSSSRLQVRSYGASRPIQRCPSIYNRQQRLACEEVNRRVEFFILKRTQKVVY